MLMPGKAEPPMNLTVSLFTTKEFGALNSTLNASPVFQSIGKKSNAVTSIATAPKFRHPVAVTPVNRLAFLTVRKLMLQVPPLSTIGDFGMLLAQLRESSLDRTMLGKTLSVALLLAPLPKYLSQIAMIA